MRTQKPNLGGKIKRIEFPVREQALVLAPNFLSNEKNCDDKNLNNHIIVECNRSC